ncbi:MAG: transcriptional repressor [Flammeovirgaceae bacterium]|nr:transcriptional repressor [Flammeovirgaceae bacterium]
MKNKDYKTVLKTHALRITDCRVDVLNVFHHSKKARSFKNLEDQLGHYDRVTLYRTLNSFIEKGILHRIPDDSGYARYALCHNDCTPQKHQHDHAHFKCDDCGAIECLEEQHVPNIRLAGYLVKEANLILSGTCKACT